MSEYEKELAYVKLILKSVKTQEDLSFAQQLKRQFISKYIILISPTDKFFLKVQNELNDLESKATTKITSGYLFKSN
jgi:hypothetical protein